MFDITEYIQSQVDKFIEDIPALQRKAYNRLITLVKELSTYGDGSIKNNLNNLQILSKIKTELSNVIINKNYSKSVKDLFVAYDTITDFQDKYFSELTTSFDKKTVFNEVKKQAIQETADGLTGAGIEANVINPIKEVLRTNIISGGSYAELTEQLRTAMLGNEEVDGALMKYAKTYVTTSANQFSAEYTKIITDDLGLEWFQYVGSLRKTSRPFCIAMVDKRYVHISELPEIVKGNIDGKKVSTAGMIEGTNAVNFQVYRGGWNCNHQLIPVAKESVPDDIRAEFE